MMDKMIFLGKNYLEHAKELGDSVPEKPVIFLKPPSVSVSVAQKGGRVSVELPRNKGSVHHETEIVLKLGNQKEIEAVTLGLDMTLRDLQGQLKAKGHPWEVGKVFPGAAILGPWIPIKDVSEVMKKEFYLKLNGEIKQHGRGEEMRMSPLQAIKYVEEYFPVCPGDLVFTGTPAGVGPVVPGQLGELFWDAELLFQVQFI